MQSFKQFLTEAILPDAVDGIIALLRKDCADYISQSVPQQPLLRGYGDMSTARKSSLLNKRTVRKDRKAVDTPQEFNVLFDNLSKGILGFKPRSDTLFTTLDKEAASDYGSIYYVFPIGEFKFMYLEGIRDFYSVFFGVGGKTAPSEDVQELFIEQVTRFMRNTLGQPEYNISSFSEARTLFNYRTTNIEERLELIEPVLEYIVAEKMRTADISKAGESEIMVANDEYYMISLMRLKDLCASEGTTVQEFLEELKN